MRTCSYAPPSFFAKSPASGSLTTYQISAQSTQPFPRYGKGGTSARVYVRTCIGNPPVTCVICVAARSPNAHQILSPSAHPFLSYSLAANFDNPSLCTCHVPQWLFRWMGVDCIHGRKNVSTPERKPFVKRICGCWNISLAKAGPRPAGRPAGRSCWLFSVILKETSGHSARL